MNQPAPQKKDYIELRNVSKVFRTDAGAFTALDSIDAGFKHQEFVSVVGKSGSGKSTMMNMITGIDHPSSGEVWINDRRTDILPENDQALWRGRSLGIVFQFYQLLPVLSLYENVLLPMQITRKLSAKDQSVRAMALLEQVGVVDFAHHRPHAVSGGQQQSTAIARALANDPPILIADEPTGNLDSAAGERIIQIFEELSQQDKTIIMVTHDPDLARRADRSLVLSDGMLVDEVRHGEGSKVLEELLGRWRFNQNGLEKSFNQSGLIRRWWNAFCRQGKCKNV